MNSDSEPPPLTSTPYIIDTREFFLPGAGASALLVHGLTGTPYEMRYLGERLSAAGVRVFAVRLAGHAGTPEELGATDHNAWYESVVDGVQRLRAYGDPIVVVGLSAGGVLAARLAVDQGEALSGVVMLAPAFYLPFWQRAALAGLGVKKLRALASTIYLRSTAGADIHDAAARQVHPSAHLMPLSAALSLRELSALVRPRLGRLTQPTMLIHSRRDHTCPFEKNVEYVMANLGSARKRLVALDESYHVITVDTEKERVASEVLGFIRELFGEMTEPKRALG
jgi:carboxylesterase